MELAVKLNSAPQNEYPIVIREGLLEEIGEHIEASSEGGNAGCGKNFIVTNETVKALYGKYFEGSNKNFSAEFIVIGDGEEYKNFQTYEFIVNELLARKIERKSKLIALGGGVVGDITGFVASSVLRGVDFIQVPTTLLAQVDSSVGGKTGINTRFGKNLVGTFYQPKKVLIDPKTLQTLDARQIKTGLAEVVKYAFIEKTASGKGTFGAFGVEFFDFLQNNNPAEHYPYIIAESCQIKANVVRQDEKESGLRAILNLGHTFGHALEKVTNYTEITHGEGVAAGIACAFRLALELRLVTQDYFNNSIALLEKLGLETKIPENIDRKAVYEAMKSDKKVRDTQINFILPSGPGEVTQRSDIGEPLIIKSLL